MAVRDFATRLEEAGATKRAARGPAGRRPTGPPRLPRARRIGTGGHWEALTGSGCHVRVAGSLGYPRPSWGPPTPFHRSPRRSAHGRFVRHRCCKIAHGHLVQIELFLGGTP